MPGAFPSFGDSENSEIKNGVNDPSNKTSSKTLAPAPIEKKQRFPPVLTLPQQKKRKREGYGFSYSDTIWQDSDEYPDTDDGELDGDTDVEPDDSASSTPGTKHEADPNQKTDSSNVTNSSAERSFNDVVVVRPLGSFHVAKPQRKFPCTAATREDTIRSRVRAKRLIKRYPQSPEIQANMLSRVERMVRAAVKEGEESGTGRDSLTYKCSERLWTFLGRSKVERLATGEGIKLVEHEGEWANWLLESSRTGVLHVIVPGCTCRPDWGEEEET